MIDFTTVVGLDEAHLEEWRLTWPTWARLRPEILTQPLLAVCDAALPPSRWAEALDFVHHPRLTVVSWDMPGVPQREKMLTGLTLAPATHVHTPWFLKLDTDTMAGPSGPSWILDEWFVPDERGREPAFVAPPWGYTKPADALLKLDDWGDTVPALRDWPRLAIPVPEGAFRVRCPRITSWCFFGRTTWLREATAAYNGRLPVPSQDTYLWYFAARRQDFFRRVRMARMGWAHIRSRRRLHRACQAVLGEAPSISPSPPAPLVGGLTTRLLDLLLSALPSTRTVHGVCIGGGRGETGAALLAGIPNLCLLPIDPKPDISNGILVRAQPQRHVAIPVGQSVAGRWAAEAPTGHEALQFHALAEAPAAAEMPDGSLDFVFLDVEHAYPAARAELQKWWPKVRAGGLLLGHGYGRRQDRQGEWGGRQAVDEWATELGLVVGTCVETTAWWARKPAAATTTGTGRVFYLLSGAGHGPRFVVSLWSLRRFYDGPVTVYTTLPESHLIGQRCAADPRLGVEHRTISAPAVARNATCVAKIVITRLASDHSGVFLDADTLVTGDIRPVFDALEESPFVATRFVDWLSSGRPVRGRIESWRPLAEQTPDPTAFHRLLDGAICPRAVINAGVYGWRPNSTLLGAWEDLCRFGCRKFICEEISLQILLHNYPHKVLDHRFNCSSSHAAREPDARIWHFHGGRHLGAGKGQDLWVPAFQACLEENPGGLVEWAAAVEPKLAEFMNGAPVPK